MLWFFARWKYYMVQNFVCQQVWIKYFLKNINLYFVHYFPKIISVYRRVFFGYTPSAGDASQVKRPPSKTKTAVTSVFIVLSRFDLVCRSHHGGSDLFAKSEAYAYRRVDPAHFGFAQHTDAFSQTAFINGANLLKQNDRIAG